MTIVECVVTYLERYVLCEWRVRAQNVSATIYIDLKVGNWAGTVLIHDRHKSKLDGSLFDASLQVDCQKGCSKGLTDLFLEQVRVSLQDVRRQQCDDKQAVFQFDEVSLWKKVATRKALHRFNETKVYFEKR